MFNINVTETGKDHTGANFEGLVNIDGAAVVFASIAEAEDFILANLDFFDDFAAVDIVTDSAFAA